ncbi:MAG: PAS domain S-box protein [Hellea sp.]|nr:PAS domain S-box protein [Hellea sp.]
MLPAETWTDANISELPLKFLAHFEAISAADPRNCVVIDTQGKIHGLNPPARRALPWLASGVNLMTSCADPKALKNYLVTCARTRAALPGTVHLTDPDGLETEWTCHGGLVDHLEDDTPILILRMQIPELGKSVFAKLNDKIEALNAELEWRVRADDATAHLAAIVASSVDAIYSKDLEKVVTSWNKGAEIMFGYSADEMIGASILSVVPDDKLAEEEMLLKRLRDGEILAPIETVRQRKDGKLIDVSITSSPITNRDGDVVGYSKILRDVSERIAAVNHQKLLMQELAHRSKNQMAVISAMARQTAKNSKSIQDFRKTFEQRLQGLSVSIGLLVERGWSGAPLDQLINIQSKTFITEKSKLRCSGPDVTLDNVASEAIGLALHELATNSLKYGAWSSRSGFVTLSWEIIPGDAGDLEIVWKEQGGPAVKEPSHTGFGQIVIERLVAQKLSTDVKLVYSPEGVIWTFRLPAQHFSLASK